MLLCIFKITQKCFGNNITATVNLSMFMDALVSAEDLVEAYKYFIANMTVTIHLCNQTK